MMPMWEAIVISLAAPVVIFFVAPFVALLVARAIADEITGRDD
jgi:hypothetical protein